MRSRRGVESISESMPTMTWPFSRRSPNSALRPWGRMPMSAPSSRSARQSSTDRSIGWCSSQAASPVKLSRMTWQGTPATSAWTWPRNRGGSARPARWRRLPGEGAGDVDRGERHGPIEDVDAETPRLDPIANPHLGVRRAARGEGQDEPSLGLAQDHPVVHDVAALVEQQRVARAAGLDVGDMARVEPLQELDDVGARHDELAQGADVADRTRPPGPPSTRRPRRRSATAATSCRSDPSARRARDARRGAACAGRRRRRRRWPLRRA